MSIYDIKISLKPLSSTWVLYQLFTVPLVTLLGSCSIIVYFISVLPSAYIHWEGGGIPMTWCMGGLLMFGSQCFGLNFSLKMSLFWKSGRYRWLLITLKAYWSVLEIYVLYEFYYIISHFCEYKSLCPLTLQNQVLR